jgi:hypothetical protein
MDGSMRDDSPVRVLVVSSDTNLRETAATLALKHGAYVATTTDAKGVTRICASAHPPDVLLVDERHRTTGAEASTPRIHLCSSCSVQKLEAVIGDAITRFRPPRLRETG